MGFWSGLGKVLKVGAPLAASFIPGVGPMASKVLNGVGSVVGAATDAAGGTVAGDIGTVAGNTAGGLREERNTEDTAARMRDALALQRQQQGATQTQNRDQLALSTANAGIGQNATRDAQAMQRAQLGIDAPMARTKQAAFGDALQNVQDVNLDFQPTTGALPKFGITGGLRPSMFGENARAAGGELGKQALAALMSKSDVPAASDPMALPEPSPLTGQPELSMPKPSSGLEKVTGAVGLGGGILGALGPILAGLKKRQAKAPATMQPQPLVDPNLRGVRF